MPYLSDIAPNYQNYQTTAPLYPSLQPGGQQSGTFGQPLTDFASAVGRKDPAAIQALLSGNNPIARVGSATLPAVNTGGTQAPPGLYDAFNGQNVAAPSSGNQSLLAQAAGTVGGGYGGSISPNPVASASNNFQGQFIAPRSVSEDQKNTNSLLTSLATGSGVQDANGNVYSPADVMANLARQGNPLGTAWVNANTGFREDKIGQAGAADQQAYRNQAQQFASGAAGNRYLNTAASSARDIGASGQNDLNAASGRANQAAQVAAGMNGDIAGLRQAAAGNVPSAAQIQQRQGISDAINSQASLAASARGGNLAAAMRGAQAAGAGIQAQGVANNAALRANEMATARGQLTQATGTQGSLFNAAGGLNNQAAQSAIARQSGMAGLQAQLGSTGLNAQQVGMGALGNAYEQAQARTMNQINTDQDEQRQLQNYMLQLFNTANGNAASIDNSQRAAAVQTRGQDLQLAGGLAAGAGGVLGGVFSGLGK